VTLITLGKVRLKVGLHENGVDAVSRAGERIPQRTEGEVIAGEGKKGNAELSYFKKLSDAEAFSQRDSLVKTGRGGGICVW